MSDVVQITCPHCRNTLRIPTNWVDQPMRCKFCQQVFQAHRKPVAIAAAAPAAPSRPTNNHGVPRPFPSPPTMARPTSGRAVPFKAVLVGCLVLAGVGLAAMVILIVLGSALWKMVDTDRSGQQANANRAKPPGTSNAKDSNPPGEPGNQDLKTDPGKGKDQLPGKGPANQRPEPPEAKKIPADKQQGPLEAKKGPGDQEQLPPEKKKGPEAKGKGPKDKAKPPPAINKGPPLPPVVQAIFNELALLPPATGGKAAAIDSTTVPEFAPDVLATYEADYATIREFRDREAVYPLRAAVVKAVEALQQDNGKGPKFRQTIPGNLKDKELLALKNQVKNEQDAVALRAALLKDLLRELVDSGAKYQRGETKRWQVLFDFVLLRLKARVVYVVEYNFNLAQIRTDNLMPLEKDDTLYRLTAQEKVSVKEEYIKQYVKDLKKGWTNLAQNYPATPWAFMAPREQAVLLGLSWQSGKK